MPPTTSAAGPLAPVDTRNPVPVLPPGAVRAGEFLDAAVALPDGSFLVATGPDQFDLCSITILRVGADGSRTHFADGRAPQVAPNGRHVVYAARRAVPPDGCAAADPVIVDLRTGERHALDAGAVGDGEIAVDFIWSPDSARVSMMRGFYYSEFTTGAVVDVGARSLVRLQVVPALRAELEARLGIAPGFEWVVFPSRWLTDGSLAVETACCYGEHVDYRGVPQWWRLAPGGTQVRSFEQAITDDDLIARLSRGG